MSIVLELVNCVLMSKIASLACKCPTAVETFKLMNLQRTTCMDMLWAILWTQPAQ